LKYCCKYPDFVFLEEDWNICAAKCSAKNYTDDDFDEFCCEIICAFEKVGLFINGELAPQGLINSLAASVDFDTAWMYVIDNSVNRCYDSGELDW